MLASHVAQFVVPVFLVVYLYGLFSQVSAFSCGISYSFLSCFRGDLKGISIHQQPFHQVVQSQELFDPFYYDAALCTCVERAEKLKYNHVALVKTPEDTVACYGVHGEIVPVKLRMKRTLNLFRHHYHQQQNEIGCINAYANEDMGSVLIGHGQNSAIYYVLPSFVTLPTSKPTHMRTEILTSPIRKQIKIPPRPEIS